VMKNRKESQFYRKKWHGSTLTLRYHFRKKNFFARREEGRKGCRYIPVRTTPKEYPPRPGKGRDPSYTPEVPVKGPHLSLGNWEQRKNKCSSEHGSLVGGSETLPAPAHLVTPGRVPTVKAGEGCSKERKRKHAASQPIRGRQEGKRGPTLPQEELWQETVSLGREVAGLEKRYAGQLERGRL